MEGGLGAVRSNVDMEYGLSSQPTDQSFPLTGLSPSFTFRSVPSELSTLVHSERASASTSVSSFSYPREAASSQMMDMNAINPACPSCDATGLPFFRVSHPLLLCGTICSLMARIQALLFAKWRSIFDLLKRTVTERGFWSVCGSLKRIYHRV